MISTDTHQYECLEQHKAYERRLPTYIKLYEKITRKKKQDTVHAIAGIKPFNNYSDFGNLDLIFI